MHKKNFVLATLPAVAIVAVLFASTTTLADPGITTSPNNVFTQFIEQKSEIDRGYEKIVERLSFLGADIKRVS